MASNYPTSLDNFTNPSAGASLSSPSHSTQHGDVNDAVEALEAKLGIGSSAASAASEGAVLKANGSGSSTWNKAGLWFVTSVSVGTAVTSIEILNAFNTNYDSYKIIGNGISATADESIRLVLGNAGGYSTTGYDSGGIFEAGGASLVASGVTTSWNFLGSTDATCGACIDIEVHNPFLTARSFARGTYARQNVYGTPTGTHNVSASYDRCKIEIVSGTVTGGTIRVYGYQK